MNELEWTTANDVAARYKLKMPPTWNDYENNPKMREKINSILTQEAINEALQATPQETPNRMEHIIRKAAMIRTHGSQFKDLYDDPKYRDETTKIYRNYLTGGS
tara:strand:+ start:2210 stop:2521 length:312 start_codon:yes stop_codon:yes gene_type:complete